MTPEIDSIPLEERKALISSHPLFKALPPDLMEELVSLAFQKSFKAGEVIVSQNEIVDAIYFIAKGGVEVDKEINLQHEMIPQAILREGDAIGLNQLGFYSETGLRTATLISVTDVMLIGLYMDTFSAFLEKYPFISSSMRRASEILLRINFIKQVEPFADLPKERISWLGTHIEEKEVQAGTILFQSGETGTECYLVQSGEVEITIKNIDGTEKKIATLTPPMLFGETALLTSTKRNATAIMSKSGKLLVIKKEQFDELMQHHSTTESMMLLSVIRSRPLQSEGVEHYHRKSDEGQDIVILKDTRYGKYFQLSPEGWFIWQKLNGTNTLQDLTVELFKEKNVFCPDAIADTVCNLADAGFVQLTGVPLLLIPPESPVIRTPVKKFLSRMTYFEHTFDDIDKRLTESFQKGVHLLFSSIGLTVIGLLILMGVFSFGIFAPTAFHYLQETHLLLFIIIVLVVVNFLSVILHELAHGYTTKFFKHEVRRAGIFISWNRFIAFVDTSDMWLSDKYSKIMVSLAGPIADLTTAGISSLLGWMIPLPTISLFFWLLALVLYYSVFKNLNPFMENDGYAIMKDAMHQTNLREAAFMRLFGNPISPPRKKRREAIYLSICGLFMVVDVLLAYLFQYYLQLLLPETLLGIPVSNLSWLLPSLVLLKYVLNILILKRRAANLKKKPA